MITHYVDQRTPEWYALRRGIPTASSFDKIITPKTGELSKSAGEYCNKLLAEFFLGENTDVIPVKTYWMERGEVMEVQARQFYEFKFDAITESVGFITNDEGTLGFSPDCLVQGRNKAVEIKCPAPWTHIENVLQGEIDRAYYPQVMGQMYIGGLDEIDWMSYHPELPPSIITIRRDEEYIAKLANALTSFLDMFERRKQDMIAHGATIKNVQTTVSTTEEQQPENILMAG